MFSYKYFIITYIIWSCEYFGSCPPMDSQSWFYKTIAHYKSTVRPVSQNQEDYSRGTVQGLLDFTAQQILL